MRVCRLIAKSFVLALIGGPVAAEFVGDFGLGPQGCEELGHCVLSYDFKYIDPNGLAWQAAAQNQTDGASIPAWAEPFIGSPFDPSFIKAAVIHDHYCDRHVRSWRSTHRVFYDALRELGVASSKAKLMYYAVYLAGPKWVEFIPGRSCGTRCVFEVEVQADAGTERMEFDIGSESRSPSELGTELDEGSGGAMIVSRGSTYDDPQFLEELRIVEQIIGAGDEVDLDYLERRAREVRPGDFFYANESEIVIESPLASN